MKNKYGSYIVGGKKIPFKNWEGKDWKSDWFDYRVWVFLIGWSGIVVWLLFMYLK